MISTYRSAIDGHYSDVWSSEMRTVRFTKGPIHELPEDFAVLRCAPREDRSMWTYATTCMAQPNDEFPIELHMFSATESDGEIAELLFAAAHYHRTERMLGLNDTINFGRPWIAGSICDHGLLSLPYLDGPSLEHFQISNRTIRFLWLIPISSAEASFVHAKGIDLLEEKFEASDFKFLDSGRASVV